MKRLKDFITQQGDGAKSEINSLAPNHKLVLTADDANQTKYTTCDFKDGNFRIVFHEDQFGRWQSDAFQDISKVVDKASAASSGPLSLVARSAIEKQYNPEIDAVQKEMATVLNLPDVILNPNFEANAGVLAGNKDVRPWQATFGQQTLKHFQEMIEGLKKAKFHEDDMLQEGLTEALESKEFSLNIVKKLETKETWNEILLKDGKVILNVSPPLPILTKRY